MFAKQPENPYNFEMSIVSLLTVLLLYPLAIIGDGCVLIAVALAATVGGRPSTWGASFAFFHAFYGLLGILLAGEVSEYSETLGDAFVLVGAYILLRHFVHHRLHHQVGGDCSCENHPPLRVKRSAIISTASAFSLHAFASGAIVQGLAAEELSKQAIIVLIVITSVVVGTLVGAIVYIGDRERMPILNSLDKLPSLVTLILSSVCAVSSYHLISDLRPFSIGESLLFASISLAAIGFLTARVHKGAQAGPASSLVGISRRQK